MLIEIMQHNVAFYVLDRIIFIAIVSYAIVIPLIESESQVSITSTTSIIWYCATYKQSMLWSVCDP